MEEEHDESIFMRTEIFIVKTVRASKPGKYFEDTFDPTD